MLLSAIAAVVYYPVTTLGPGWWRGAVLPDLDPPFDLGWLHDFFAWVAGNVGPVLLGLFGATVILLPVVGFLTKGFSAGPPAIRRTVTITTVVPTIALIAVPALAVGWFLLSQLAYLIAPWLGMYHGEINPVVP